MDEEFVKSWFVFLGDMLPDIKTTVEPQDTGTGLRWKREPRKAKDCSPVRYTFRWISLLYLA